MTTRELNIDGLAGPTHNHAGLSVGNLASTTHQFQVANPRAAALQGLAKMTLLADHGFAQALLPPLARPDFRLLRQTGFGGTDAAVLAGAAREAPMLLAAAYSAAPMWAANAATVSPASDTADGRIHFTVANLHTMLHRSGEHRQTEASLRAIFADARHFVVHAALPATPALADEGAANHGRLARTHGAPGVEVFVHGRSAFAPGLPAPQRYPARQTLEAAQAVARLHGLQPRRTVHLLQNPHIIDQGVFHNDVIAVCNNNVLLYHEQAFADEAGSLAALQHALTPLSVRLHALRVPTAAVSVADAVRSYLFNSQLLSRPDGGMTLLIPSECDDHPAVAAYLHTLLASNGPVDTVLRVDVRQSMHNGGGPACLRLRVVLTAAQAAAMHQGVMLCASLHAQLDAWIHRFYRDRLVPADLADPALARESAWALEALASILGLPGLYDAILS